MKHVHNLLILAAVLLSAACAKSGEPDGVAPVTVRVSGIAVSQRDFTKADPVEEFDSVTALTIAFFKSDGSLYLKQTQLLADTSTYEYFGELSVPLPHGRYTLVVLGYNSTSELSLTSPTQAAFITDQVRETFAYSTSVNISNTDDLMLIPVLQRVVSRLEIVSKDKLPERVASVKVTFADGSKRFNPSTGLALDNDGAITIEAPSSAVGAVNTTLAYIFLSTDEQTMNVTITTLDASNNEIYSKTVSNVPFKRNRITTLTGRIFTGDADVTVMMTDDWLDSAPAINF
ncbi:MAG: FimB/Mfa2 family fimbrial subunit [Bacteroidales bacterium]|nr:FimB/Mfa2 family fimbrial subunit [Bacteroidales bacterium]